MKKIFILITVLFFALSMSVYADEDFTLTFAWEQRTEDLPSLEKWTLYMRDSAGGEAIQSMDVFYLGGDGPTFETVQAFIIQGMPGDEVQRFFVVTAWSKNGEESDPSNEVVHTFTIPYQDVSPPENFTLVTVRVGVVIE